MWCYPGTRKIPKVCYFGGKGRRSFRGGRNKLCFLGQRVYFANCGRNKDFPASFDDLRPQVIGAVRFSKRFFIHSLIYLVIYSKGFFMLIQNRPGFPVSLVPQSSPAAGVFRNPSDVQRFPYLSGQLSGHYGGSSRSPPVFCGSWYTMILCE